jgi:hypothetical protein
LDIGRDKHYQDRGFGEVEQETGTRKETGGKEMIVPISNSSLIDQLERTEEGVVRVTFKSTGAVHEYDGIPAVLFNQWTQAESAGKFFHANIKGKYESRKV